MSAVFVPDSIATLFHYDSDLLPNYHKLCAPDFRPLVGRTRRNRLSIGGVLLLSKPGLRVHYIVYCT